MTRKTRALIAALAGTIVLLLAGASSCDKISEPYNDAPRGAENKSPADIIVMPDGFSNVATKCDGPNRVYVVFHLDSPYGSVAVAPNDPRCVK